MNSQMLAHPATKNSLSTLENWGARIFPTAEGSLACGEVGEGRLLEPSSIISEINKFKEQL